MVNTRSPERTAWWDPEPGSANRLETLPVVALGEDPVVVVREMPLGLEKALQMVTMLALDEDLLGVVARDELGEYLIGTLASVKLSRREVEQC